jgi:hypothetical protein
MTTSGATRNSASPIAMIQLKPMAKRVITLAPGQAVRSASPR